MTKGEVLLVSTSAKRGPSASRSILELGRTTLARYVSTAFLDLSRTNFPLYRGIVPDVHPSQVVQRALRSVKAADAVIFGVPCYWGMPSGTFVNLINVLCGPAYDLAGASTVFDEKPVGLLLVGADELSAGKSLAPTTALVSEVGGIPAAAPALVSNPRAGISEIDARRANQLFLEVARSVLRGKRT